MVLTVGVDLGSQKTVLVADDGEIVRTDTGAIAVPTLVSFVQQSRYIGDEAASFPYSTGRISLLNLAVSDCPGRLLASAAAVPHKAFFDHCPAKFEVQASSSENVSAEQEEEEVAVYGAIPYCDSTVSMTAPAILAVLIGQHARRIDAVYPYASIDNDTDSAIDNSKREAKEVNIAFVLPHTAGPVMAKNIMTACAIAGVSAARVQLVGAVEALVVAYSRKISALRPADKQALQGKNVLFAEMGHTTTTIVVAAVKASGSKSGGVAECSVDALSVQSCDTLGSLSFDLCLFSHFAAIAEKKYGEKIHPGTKRGHRLLSGCERIRKLLSQLTEASVTVENLTDSGDASFTLRRDELIDICAEPLKEMQTLVRTAIADAATSTTAENTTDTTSVAAVEILGGGMRMQVVQNALMDVLGEGVPMGAKFDDGSAALGASLLVNRSEASSNTSTTTTPIPDAPTVAGAEGDKEGGQGSKVDTASKETLDGDATAVTADVCSLYKRYDPAAPISASVAAVTAQCRSVEVTMLSRDADVRELLASRNSLEAYMYEMKGRGTGGGKHASLIDAPLLGNKMETYENWLWDNPPENTTLDTLQTQFALVQREMAELMGPYNAAVAAEKALFEKQLEEESQRAAAEREAEGEEGGEDDHDNRKLKKPDRMRMVVKNKEEGNELFKGKNYRPAAARYHKSLTHASKFFDLSPDDVIEVDQLKLSLYLNLSQCYIKLENWENTLRNVEEALKIAPSNPKALFRRSVAYEAKRDYDKALLDLTQALELNPDDVAIQKARERVSKLIAKEAAKEKKMWGRAFGGGGAAPTPPAAASQI